MKALSLGDERAWGLGISPQRLRLGLWLAPRYW